jgi:hypothetical protein
MGGKNGKIAATKWQRCGKVGGKNGNVVSGSGRTHIATPTAVME